jgi:hypothetical protein
MSSEKPKPLEELLERFIWQEANESTERNGNHAKSKRNAPLTAADSFYLESLSGYKDNEDLNSDFWEID